MKKYILIVLLLILPNVCLAEGPSFDCKKAKTCIEKFICANKDLSALDKKMSETYTNLLAKLKGEDKEQVKQNQIRWIKARDKRCEEPDMRKDEAQREVEKVYFENLFTFLYRERIEELQEWEKYVDGKKTIAYAPWQPICWKRKELVSRQFYPVTGNASVCRAFEEVLNTTCEAPDKLKCSWTLPSDEKRFQKLNWQPLDWQEYWEMIRDWRLKNIREGMNEDIREEEVMRIRKLFKDGKSSLAMAIVDINNDGVAEQVVRWDLLPCQETPGSMFGVLISGTKRLDWRYESAFLKPNASDGAEIMLYEGKIYKFGWVPGFKSLFIWDERNSRVCEFKYLKEGEKK
jgi:uncharacterized protein YecT (DUF1311 family)